MDILSQEKWSEFANQLFDRYGINCAVYEADGSIISGKPNWSNRLCPVIKGAASSLAAICAPSNQHFMAEVKNTQAAVIGECDAGFKKLAVPVIFEGQFIGAVGGCGLMAENGEIEPFIIQKTTELPEPEILKLAGETKMMSDKEGEQMAAYMTEQITKFIKTCKAEMTAAQ